MFSDIVISILEEYLSWKDDPSGSYKRLGIPEHEALDAFITLGEIIDKNSDVLKIPETNPKKTAKKLLDSLVMAEEKFTEDLQKELNDQQLRRIIQAIFENRRKTTF